MSKAVPGKFHGSAGHSKCNCLQGRAHFHRSWAWQIVLILTLQWSWNHDDTETVSALLAFPGGFPTQRTSGRVQDSGLGFRFHVQYPVDASARCAPVLTETPRFSRDFNPNTLWNKATSNVIGQVTADYPVYRKLEQLHMPCWDVLQRNATSVLIPHPGNWRFSVR